MNIWESFMFTCLMIVSGVVIAFIIAGAIIAIESIIGGNNWPVVIAFGVMWLFVHQIMKVKK